MSLSKELIQEWQEKLPEQVNKRNIALASLGMLSITFVLMQNGARVTSIHDHHDNPCAGLLDL